MESKRVPKGRGANGPPGSRALLLLWLMTCDPPPLSPAWNICHLFIIEELAEEETVARRLELEANIFNVHLSGIENGDDEVPQMSLTISINDTITKE